MNAVTGLADTIKRGDTEYIFPQDTVRVKEAIKNVMDWAIEQKFGVSKTFSIKITAQNGKQWTVFDDEKASNENSQKIRWSNFGFDVTYKNGEPVYCIELTARPLAKYNALGNFVNAVTGLINAINRGDSEYTFPAEK